MCVGPFKSPKIPAPVVQEPDPSIELEAKEARKRERERVNKERTALKEKSYEDRVAAVYGRFGRRSLLSGRKGGKGFGLQENLISKKTLGA
tara:strand:- start:945 stop:1217 length:273 start_codon:yes stop_codon:yes gene_type:complete